MSSKQTLHRQVSPVGHPVIVNYYDVAERRRITDAASQVILDEDDGFPFVCLAGMLLYTGMTLDELLALRWEAPAGVTETWPWLDLKTWQIVVLSAAKGSRRARFVPIIPQVGRLLMQWPGAKSGLLFPFPVAPALIEQRWNETIQQAQVKYIAWRDLRNTYIMLMREAGLSLDEVLKAIPSQKEPLRAQRVMS